MIKWLFHAYCAKWDVADSSIGKAQAIEVMASRFESLASTHFSSIEKVIILMNYLPISRMTLRMPVIVITSCFYQVSSVLNFIIFISRCLKIFVTQIE